MSYKELKKYKDEVIKPVKFYEPYYLVSTYGRVFSKNYRKTGKVKELAYSYLKDPRRKNHSCYVRSKMWHIKKYTPTVIHRLVAITFIKNPNNYNQVNHIDGNKSNNHVSNLEWVNNSMNQKHAFEKGLQRSRAGEGHSSNIITDEIALLIMDMIKYETPTNISKILNVSRHIVYDIKRGKTWQHLI